MTRIVPVLCFAALLGIGAERIDASGRTFVRSYSCGQSYSAQRYGYIVHHQPTYEAAQAYLYSVSYQPDIAPLLQALLVQGEEMKSLREDFKQMLQGRPQALKQEPPALALMRQDCARCHDEQVAKQMGRGYVFFRNGQVIDEGENLAQMLDAIKQGRMPKDRKWTGDQKAEVAFYWIFKQPDDAATAQAPQAAPPQPAPSVVDIERMIDQRLQIIIDRLPTQKLPQKKLPPPKKEPVPPKDKDK